MITKEFSDACNRTKLKMNKGGRDEKNANKNEAGALMDKRNVEWQEPE